MPLLLREAIGGTIRRARTERSRTLRDVSRQARVSLGYLSEIERGRKEPSSELLAAICDALALPLPDLLDDVADALRPARRVGALAASGVDPALRSAVEEALVPALGPDGVTPDDAPEPGAGAAPAGEDGAPTDLVDGPAGPGDADVPTGEPGADEGPTADGVGPTVRLVPLVTVGPPASWARTAA